MSDRMVYFPKLNGTNFDNWSFKMRLLLTKDGVWKVIKEEKPDPAPKDWDEKDELAMATIGLAVEDSQLIHIKKAKTAAEAWKNLESFHVKRTLSTKVSVMRQICALRLENNGDMEAHIGRLVELFDKLNELQPDKILDETWLVAIMFSSLSEEYDTLVTALEARSENDLTLTLVKGKLIDEWQKRRHRNSTNDDSEAALQTGSKLSKCFFCKRTGHKKVDCEKFKFWKEKQRKNTKATKEKANNVHQGNDEENWGFFVGDYQSQNELWILDSGATCHIANYRNFFDSLDEGSHEDVWVANGTKVKSCGRGSGNLKLLDNAGNQRTVKIESVLFVPEMKSNLLSVKRLVHKGYTVSFNQSGAEIIKNGTTGAVAKLTHQLFVMQTVKQSVSLVASEEQCIHEWHRRFGHRDCEAVKKLSNLAVGVKYKKCNCSNECEVCIKGKMHRSTFPKVSESKSSKVLELVHSDVCGPMRTCTPGGRKYFMTLIDDYSRYTTIYVLRKKSEVFERLKDFIEMTKTQFGRKPKIIRSDRGGEYTGKGLKEFLTKNGIKYQYTAPYNPEQNGIAERKNRSLVEMGRCMLIDAGLPNHFWGEAVVTANYLQNRLPSRSIEGTPYERWFGKQPDLKHIRQFGVDAYCHIPVEKRGKLEEKAVKLKFVGYSEVSKAYRLLDIQSGKVTISRDVKFLQNSSPVVSISDSTTEDVTVPLDVRRNVIPNVDHEPDNRDEGDSSDENWFSEDTNASTSSEDTFVGFDTDIEAEPLRRSTRSTKGKVPNKYVCSAENKVQEEPRNVQEALSSPESQYWKDAMMDELRSIESNQTWELVDLPPGKRAIGCKWVYKRKRDSNGKILRYKARLVAQGFSQRYGEDYYEVFAPVVRQTTFRTLVSVAAKKGMMIKQYDVKTAFLHGHLKEEIFMKQPPGFAAKGSERKICRLKKSLYGLKQAARSWNQRLHDVLSSMGYQQGEADPCLYRKYVNGEWSYVLIYVDDLLAASKDRLILNTLEQKLRRQFEITSLGDVRCYLGIDVERDQHGDYFISQQNYITEVVQTAGLQDAKPSNIPLDPGYEKLDGDRQLLPDNQLYQKVMGQLLYLAVNSRPDISAPVSILSRKTAKPSQQDWNELKRIVRYLKGTSDLKLRLSNIAEPSELIGYADADWAECREDRKSNSGYFFKYGGGTISWACRKQTCVSLSTAEAEFVALSEASQEALWLQRLLKDLGEEAAITIYEDNQSCLQMLNNEKFSNRTKHIATRFNFAKDLKQKQ